MQVIKRAVFTYAIPGFWLEFADGEKEFTARADFLTEAERRQCVNNPGMWQTLQSTK